MIRLLIMGEPGAGKGTQARLISEKYQIPAISTGEIFRDHIKRETELGRLVTSYINKGQYVPDEVTNQIVAERLENEDTKVGFLLDGYPRTIEQVEFLDKILQTKGALINGVISLSVGSEEVVGRLLERVKKEGRSDDTEEVIKHRLDVYHEATKPLLDVYSQRNVLHEVNGLGSIEEVFGRISTEIDSIS